MHNRTLKEHFRSEKLIMFIHGFMGSPSQFDDLAQEVYNEGFSYLCTLLPGHGDTTGAFIHNGLKEWQTHVQNEFAKFTDKYEQIYLVGHSMGGLLALNLAIENKSRSFSHIHTTKN